MPRVATESPGFSPIPSKLPLCFQGMSGTFLNLGLERLFREITEIKKRNHILVNTEINLKCNCSVIY